MYHYLALLSALAIIIILDAIHPLVLDFFVFSFLVFSYLNIENAVLNSTFYLLILLGYLVFRVANHKFAYQDTAVTHNVAGFTFQNKIPFLDIALGLFMFGVMVVIQSQQGFGVLVGVPEFAAKPISSTSLFFAVWTTMFIGVVENRFILTIASLIGKSGVLTTLSSPVPLAGSIIAGLASVLPALVASLFFGVLHLAAYGSQLSSITFAFVVFLMWSAVYTQTQQDMSLNISHSLWNGWITAGRSLVVV